MNLALHRFRCCYPALLIKLCLQTVVGPAASKIVKQKSLVYQLDPNGGWQRSHTPTPKSARITKSQCPSHRKSRWCGIAYGQANGALELFKTLPELTMIRQLDADLAKHPFVFGMSTQDVGLLADCALKVHFRKGELIFREGEKAEKVYLIESGTVALEAYYAPKSIVVVDTIGAGELLGLSWLIPPHKWRVSARACESTTAIVFIGAILHEYSERDHSLGFQLFKRISEVMARRLESSRQRLLELAAEHRTSRSGAALQHSAGYDDESSIRRSQARGCWNCSRMPTGFAEPFSLSPAHRRLSSGSP